jgi:hypothetical protein
VSKPLVLCQSLVAKHKAVQFGIAGFLVLSLVVFLAAVKVRGDAGQLLAALRRMVSSDPNVEFETLRKRYGTKLTKGEDCTALDCQYHLEMNNRAVSWTRLFPYTEWDAYFTIYQGRFEYFLVSFRQQFRHQNSPVIHVQFVRSNDLLGAFSLNPHGRSHELWNGMIDFNLAATPKQREAAMDVNLDCIVKIGGCHNIAEMSPGIWKVTSPNVIYSRMPSGSDAIGDEYAP